MTRTVKLPFENYEGIVMHKLLLNYDEIKSKAKRSAEKEAVNRDF